MLRRSGLLFAVVSAAAYARVRRRVRRRWALHAHAGGGNHMGFDDLVNQAKGLLGSASDKADDAKANAAAGNPDAAAADAAQSSNLIDKAKELLTDERIDQVAGLIKDKTPDNIDKIVDQAAEKGKQFN
jgi:hypothetical protein